MFDGALRVAISLAALTAAQAALAAPAVRSVKKVDPVEKAMAAIKPLAGPVTIIVSISEQRLALYDGDRQIEGTTVSTGVTDHPTPTGVFSVIEKDRFHKSNIYSDAPMPFMQRLTWSGIALHEGHVTGRPASHGCIRLPAEFARKLWRLTRVGARVIIANESVALAHINHAALFKPAEPQPATAPSSATPIAVAPKAETAVVVVKTESATGELKTETTELVTKVQPAPKGESPSEEPAAQPGEKFGPPAPTIAQWVQMRRKSGPISVFVSRKEGKLFVRQDMKPLFDAPIELADKSAPLGTHVFTAQDYAGDKKAMRWTVATMPSSFAPRPPKAPPAKAAQKGKPVVPVIEQIAPLAATPAQALERFKPSPEAAEQIAQLLTPGSTLILSDMGLGWETGKGTDFIVLRN